ncbi:MAG: hypothetical protein LKF75_01590 [Bacilli bacterium]|jgi:hypothetical protein|nr:hypothetical protein [Bacilli bacterium]MCH4210869.1 hypothetical protein [Bacilli bacterium]MCH4228385.1 hypothetical protein [Bacilli bacterium]MCH4277928.1 hypothetical protein [Bacilli bacterium]MCI2054884.1 hypothetical protein [Bacilli bacterium]
MNYGLLVSFVLMSILSLFFELFLGIKGHKEKKEDYDVMSYFPYELYGDSRGNYFLFSRIAEAFRLLCFVAVPLFLLIKLVGYGGMTGSYSVGIMLMSVFFAISSLLLTIIPLKDSKQHLAYYFISSACGSLTIVMEGLLLLSLRKSGNETISYIFSIACFVIAVSIIALWFNPKLKNWAKMDSISEPDGTVSFRRPHPFVLAFSEWLTIFISLGGSIIAAIGFLLLLS